MKKVTNDKPIRLTTEEYNLLNDITSQTKTDCWFWLEEDEEGFDYVQDGENGCKLEWKDALEQLNEAIIPDLLKITNEEIEVYISLLKKLNISDNPFEEYIQVITNVYDGNANGICTEDTK